MTINNQIEALSIKNTMVKPVNMTEFNNPFLLLSSTKALNELVVNTNPSSRAKVANIEPTKSKFQQNPLGVPIDVYTKDSATGAKDLSKKLKAGALPDRPSLKAREIKKRAETITAAAIARQKKAKAISKLSKQTASSAISSALSNVGKKAKAKKEQQASLKAAVKKGSNLSKLSNLSKQTASSAKTTPAKASNVKAPKASAGGGAAKATEETQKKRGRTNQGLTAARVAEATKRRVEKAKKALGIG